MADMTLSEMRDLLTKLQTIWWSGEREIRYVANGVERSVTYRSQVELRDAAAALQAKIAAAEGKPALKVAYVRSEKGFL